MTPKTDARLGGSVPQAGITDSIDESRGFGVGSVADHERFVVGVGLGRQITTQQALKRMDAVNVRARAECGDESAGERRRSGGWRGGNAG